MGRRHRPRRGPSKIKDETDLSSRTNRDRQKVGRDPLTETNLVLLRVPTGDGESRHGTRRFPMSCYPTSPSETQFQNPSTVRLPFTSPTGTTSQCL